MSFRHKILMLLVGSMCLAQVATMLATLVTTEDTVRRSVNEDLIVAGRAFDQLFEQRFHQLSQSAQGVSDDSGFRSALASRDAPTIRSVLENHAARAGASLALFLDSDTGFSAGTVVAGEWLNGSEWQALRQRIARNDSVLATLSLEGIYHQVAVVPVMAPARAGWVVMGFPVDDGLAATFRAITGLHITIHDPRDSRRQEPVTTLGPSQEAALLRYLDENGGFVVDVDGALDMPLGEESFLTRLHPLADGINSLQLVLQKSLDQEMQPYYRLEETLVMLFAAILLIAVLGGIGIGGSIMAPVRRLGQLAERVGSGNYGVEIRLESRDEIGQLGTALNTMQQEIARREQRIIHQTQHDELTDLPNRNLVRDRIEQAIVRAERTGMPFTLVMLDIARFKQINDTLGHHIGDVVLKEAANRLRRRQRRTDTVARLGGDDFLLLLESTNLPTSLKLVQDQLLPLLTSPQHLDGVELSVKLNCGFVEYPTHGDDAVALLRRCEVALYEAKKGLHGTAVYEAGRDESHRREMAIVSDIDRAMQENQLRLYYQPKLDLRTGDIRGVEALVRWQHPAFGFLPPDEFIGVLEQTGNIKRLTQWVLLEAARQCSQWRSRDLELAISINLSALDLLEGGLLAQVEQAMQRYNLARDMLVLEIRESTLMQDPGAARTILTQLRQAGYRISIDDFGTGYSSLAQLKTLPVGELKIDKSFILELMLDSQDAVIVKSTIELAHSMGLHVVAEGIENEQGLRLLQQFGCDTGQGYFISRPLPAAEVEAWCLENRERLRQYRRQAA